MATKLEEVVDAAKMEEEFRRQQTILADRSTLNAFPRTTRILAFVGALLICLTLIKIPKTEGCRYPLLLHHDLLYSFTASSVAAILLNLFVLLMYLLSYINGSKFNNATAPSVEFIQKRLGHQKKFISFLDKADRSISSFGFILCVYSLVVAVFGSILPLRENTFAHAELIERSLQMTIFLTLALKFAIDGMPRHMHAN